MKTNISASFMRVGSEFINSQKSKVVITESNDNEWGIYFTYTLEKNRDKTTFIDKEVGEFWEYLESNGYQAIQK